jgi:hypothetical protein
MRRLSTRLTRVGVAGRPQPVNFECYPRRLLSEPSATGEALTPGDRVEGLGNFGRPTGEFGTVSEITKRTRSSSGMTTVSTANHPFSYYLILASCQSPFDVLRKVLTNPKKDFGPNRVRAAAARTPIRGTRLHGWVFSTPSSSIVNNTGRAALLTVSARAIVVHHSRHTSGLHLATKLREHSG